MEIQWALVLFTVVSGAGAWLFASSMLASLLKKGEAPTRLETILAFALLVVGGCMSVMHLSHVDRIMEALNRPTSGIFVEAAMIGVTCAVLAVYFILTVRGASEGSRKVVGAVGMVLAALFTFACGSSYMMEARPAWTTITLPLAYFGTAAAAGCGLNLLCKAVQGADDDAVSFAGILAAAGGALGAILAAAYCAIASAYLAASEDGAVTWVAAVFVGAVVEIACGLLASKKPSGAAAMGAVCLVAGVVAAIALRVAMWLLGTPFMDFFLMPME